MAVREWAGCHRQLGKGHSPPGPGARGQATPEPCLPPQLLANAVVFLCGNLTGAFHKHHMQGAALELFTYTVKCIQIRRKLRIEKRQQVGAPPLPPTQAPAWPTPRPESQRPSLWAAGALEPRVQGPRGRTPLQAHPRGCRGHAGMCARLGWWQDTGQWRWRGDGQSRKERRVGKAWVRRRPACPPPVPRVQENLLLSVLPAHISMGMKLTIIERLKECGDRRYLPDNNFHSLYVKRHQNVRWAAAGPVRMASPGEAPRLPPPVWAVGGPELRLQRGGLVHVWLRLPRQPPAPRASVCSSGEWDPARVG